MTGTFIVLEGPDGSGTTTHAQLLAEWLRAQGKEVVLTSEPTSGPIGKFIREQLRKDATCPPDALQLLFTADRAMHVQNEIIPALERGAVVISDRYAPSTICYGEALGLDFRWLEQANAAFRAPDLYLLLLPPIRVTLERLRERKSLDRLEEDSLQGRVHKAYRRWAAEHASVPVVDTSVSKEEAFGEIRTLVDAFFVKRQEACDVLPVAP